MQSDESLFHNLNVFTSADPSTSTYDTYTNQLDRPTDAETIHSTIDTTDASALEWWQVCDANSLWPSELASRSAHSLLPPILTTTTAHADAMSTLRPVARDDLLTKFEETAVVSARAQELASGHDVPRIHFADSAEEHALGAKGGGRYYNLALFELRNGLLADYVLERKTPTSTKQTRALGSLWY